MRSWLLIVLSISCQAKAQAPEKELTDILNSMTSLRADFTQRLEDTKAKLLQESKGRMTILKPGLFKWEILSPNEITIIVDNNEILNYDKVLEQVIIQKYSAHNDNLQISGLLTGKENIAKNFNVTQSTECKYSSKCFLLKPKNEEADFSQAILGFKNNTLNFFKLLDNLGQKSVFNFNNIKLNVPVKASEFKFNIPPNVDVIKVSEK